MIRDAKKFADQDSKAKARMEARQAIENLIRGIESALREEVGKALDKQDKEVLSAWKQHSLPRSLTATIGCSVLNIGRTGLRRKFSLPSRRPGSGW
jgi:hypothetical protein